MTPLGIAVVVIISILFGFFINSVIYHARQNVKIGAPAPGFYGEFLDGSKIGHSDWDRPPNPILLCFVSLQCSVCRVLAPVLDGLSKKYSDSGIQIIFLGINGSHDNYKNWAEKLNLTLPVAIDVNEASRNRYAVYSLPALYYITSAGIIQFKHTGFREGDREKLENVFIKRMERLKSRELLRSR